MKGQRNFTSDIYPFSKNYMKATGDPTQGKGKEQPSKIRRKVLRFSRSVFFFLNNGVKPVNKSKNDIMLEL